MDILEKLKKVRKHDFATTSNDIHIAKPSEIKEMQLGFSVDLDGNKIKDWIGENYLVIGNDYTCGDPIIVKTDEEVFPVYFMWHDDWETLEKVADSFDEYISILTKIDKAINKDDKEKINALLLKIKTKMPKYFDYYEILLALDEEE